MHGVPTHFIAELELLESAREHAADPSRFPLPKGMLEGETFDFSSLRTGLTRYVAVTRCSCKPSGSVTTLAHHLANLFSPLVLQWIHRADCTDGSPREPRQTRAP